jgi:Golgi phosphoprotein 3 (GPP34)
MTSEARGQQAPAPRLAGTGQLADDLYLIAHHERTGKVLLAPRAAGLGLAGGLLAELTLAGAIGITAGMVAAGPVPPGDALTAGVVRQVSAEPQRHPVADWLAFLARTAAQQVADRLAQAGYLAPAPAWPPWRGPRWVPVDADCAFAPVTRIHSAIGQTRPADAQAVALAALAAACGLGARLALYLPLGSRARLDQAADQLDPDLREVITQTQAAVDAAVLAHRV